MGPKAHHLAGAVRAETVELLDASFMAEASRDPAIERYNGPAPASVADAVAVIERIQQSWHTFEVEGDPTGAAFVIIDADWASRSACVASISGRAQTSPSSGTGGGRCERTRACDSRSHADDGLVVQLGAAGVLPDDPVREHRLRCGGARAGSASRERFVPTAWKGQRQDMDVFAMLPDEWPSRGNV